MSKPLKVQSRSLIGKQDPGKVKIHMLGGGGVTKGLLGYAEDI